MESSFHTQKEWNGKTDYIPDTDFALTEAARSSLLATSTPFEAASMSLCANSHSCSVPNQIKTTKFCHIEALTN